VISKVSPDGSTLAYSDYLSDGYHTTLMPWDGSTGREICTQCAIEGFSSDSKSVLVSRVPKGISLINLATGQETQLLNLTSGNAGSPCLSPDDRWLAFVLSRPDGSVAIDIVPRGEKPVLDKAGVLIVESDRYLGSPQWSPDGNTLYFISTRDDGCGIWGRRLAPKTKDGRGEPFRLFQPRGVYRLNVPVDSAAMAVARNKFVFFMATVTGNIYMAAPKTR
jgi:Tol biopolymer transport system component